MDRESKFFGIGMFVLVITLLSLSLVQAEVNMSDPLAYQRYTKITDEFDKGNEWVPISVNVFSEEMREEVISSLSELEFRDLRRELTKTVFSGEITSGGLDNLVDHPNVKWVNLQEAVSTDEPENNETTENESQKGESSSNETQDEEPTPADIINYNWLYWLGGVILIVIFIFIIYKIKKR